MTARNMVDTDEVPTAVDIPTATPCGCTVHSGFKVYIGCDASVCVTVGSEEVRYEYYHIYVMVSCVRSGLDLYRRGCYDYCVVIVGY